MTLNYLRTAGTIIGCSILLLTRTLTLRAAGDVDLGVVPFGTNGAVRLVEVAALSDSSQQMIHRGDKLYFALQGGVVEEFTKNSDGTLSNNPGLFLDVASERGSVLGNNPVATSNGLRGIAFHPDFDNNGMFYTMQTENRGPNPTHSLDPNWTPNSSPVSQFGELP